MLRYSYVQHNQPPIKTRLIAQCSYGSYNFQYITQSRKISRPILYAIVHVRIKALLQILLSSIIQKLTYILLDGDNDVSFSEDCLGDLLSDRKNKVAIVSGTSNFTVPCDHLTSGGGWMIVGKRTEIHDKFNKTEDSYIKGFRKDIRNFWLGSNTLAFSSKKSPELLIDLTTSNGHIEYNSLCSYFKVISNPVVTVKTDRCSGYGVSLSSLTDVKNLFTNSSFSKVVMKIRPTKGMSIMHAIIIRARGVALHL